MSMRFERRDASVGSSWTMTEMKPEPLDYVEDFQDYLDQENHHETLTGSVEEEEEEQTEHAGEDLFEEEHATAMDQLASIEVYVDDEALPDGFEKMDDGRMKCRYCNYTNRSTTRLIEHVRIHTGEKPHRCQLCPFSSAYLRHLEAHLRSHAGEKPYKCGLCSFRCNDRSNLSRHRRRHHKYRAKTTRQQAAPEPPSAPQERPASRPHGQAHPPDDLGPQPAAGEAQDYANGFCPKSPVQTENPPHPNQEAPAASLREEQLDLTATHIILSPGSSSATVPHVPPRTLYFCSHCQTYFSDNVMYTVHMGCHGYDQPFQCNVCGEHCGDKYTFACHFARGLHRK
ncbi:zinc finger protein Pegasus-like [Trichomycterus rosablanca]|uniref:zinc finger protein Pegasus-like n=1 Tax=Trichomycterus rosablanca TaxID=2290929 RepID=UPI002F353781